jgi:phosphinothricin acetyltransferase
MTACIRLANENDAGHIQAIYTPIVSHTAISFEIEPPTIVEMQQRIVRTLVHLPWLVFEREGIICGYAYASKHRLRTAYQWSVDVSVYIHPQARRTGIGRALYCSLFRILRMQGYFNVYAGIALPNRSSVGLHEAVGFRPIGIYREVGYKLGAWHDVGWWQLPLQPTISSPEVPKDVQTVQQFPEWKTALAAGEGLLKG